MCAVYNQILREYEETIYEVNRVSKIKTLQIILFSLIPPFMILLPHIKNLVVKSITYLKTLFLFNFLFCNIYQIEAKTPEQMIRESIANYPGKCPCPYSIMSNGNKCGKRSAYSKPGGYEPLCYISDITREESSKSSTTKPLKNIRIIDGDTIHIDKIKYRLHGIDAPEMKQLCKINEKNYKCGVKSKEFLVSLIGNKPVRCVHKDVDRYKRIVAECFVNNINLNKELVKHGWALAYTDYSKDYVDDENFAKENNLGMWKGTFVEPKKWRKRN